MMPRQPRTVPLPDPDPSLHPDVAARSAGLAQRAPSGTPPPRKPTIPPSRTLAPDSVPPSIPSAAGFGVREALSVADATATVTPGQVIAGRYEVTGVLGEGGMGIVYSCYDRAAQTPVAVKRVIPPAGNLAQEYLVWFYKEARALAALAHPSIVQARDFGQLVDGSPYLAMDLVAGLSLHDLSHARLSFPLLWSIADQILSALAHAHARGIIHGDLKPSNILIEQVPEHPPQIHVLDFGLAWLKHDPHDERLDGEKAMEFAPHAGAGTPGYMAPEQIQHEHHHVSGASDLYALGSVLYKLFSGHAPFTDDPKELLRLHAFENVPDFTLQIPAPPEVIPYVMRLLAKRPWDRWEYAAEARQVWAQWRPALDTPVSHWRLPHLERTTDSPRAPTKAHDAQPVPPTPELAASEKTPGLLSIRPSPLVGREEVRNVLRETCDDVIDSSGAPHRLVLLVGAAGAGKSRIAEWLCEVVHEEGSMVPLKARYRPISGALDGMLGAAVHHFNFEHADRDTIEHSLLARWKVTRDDINGRNWVAGAAEWFRPLPPHSKHVGPSGTRFSLDTLETRRMVIQHTLRRIAHGRPLLFWLDDLHHAGQATFDGLLRIHDKEPDQRIVMVATVRAEDVHLGTETAERLRELLKKLSGTVLQIDPLEPEVTRTLLRKSLPLDDDAVIEAARRSRGNPLFALQQLHAWASGGNMELANGVYRVPSDVLAVRPQTTAELWDTRIASLPEAHRLAAYAAATLSGDIRREVLHALLRALRLPEDAALVSLQKSEILIPHGTSRYAWPHALLQEHLLESLKLRDDAKVIYQAAAEALVHHPLATTRRVTRQRVVNLLHAGQANDAATLLFHFIEDNWSGRREPRATLLDLDLLKSHVTGPTKAALLRWQGEALRVLGRTDAAIKQTEAAKALFESMGDLRNLAHCLKLLGHVQTDRGQPNVGLNLIRSALPLYAQLSDPLGQAQCSAIEAEIQYYLGNYDAARDAAGISEAYFRDVGQALGLGQSLLLKSWVEHSEGRLERSSRLVKEARFEFERAGYRLGVAQADASLAHVDYRLQNLHAAETLARTARSAFMALRTLRGQAGCDRLVAMIGVDLDDAAMAQTHLELAKEAYSQLSDPWGILECELLCCQVALLERRYDDAARLLQVCHALRVEEAEPRQHYLMTRAWLEHAQNSPRKALTTLRAAASVYPKSFQSGDHCHLLLSRILHFNWSEAALGVLREWQAALGDRGRRDQQ